jgi:hypothetical protein
MADPTAFEMHEVFGAIARSVVEQQQRLDTEYLADLDAFEQCFRQAGYSALGREFVPTRPVVREAQVECSLGVRQTQENTFSIHLGNRVVATRYLHSQSFNTKVQVTVARVPLAKNDKNSRGE